MSATESPRPTDLHHVGLDPQEKQRLWLKVMKSREELQKGSDHGSVHEDGDAKDESSKGLLNITMRPRKQTCTLDADHKHGWKPLTLRAPILLTFALASLTIAIVVEIFAQRSHQQGGLALSDSADNLSSPRVFFFSLIPTIVSVIYSLCWSWIDLDVKRLQPWLELSRENGTTAARSLFLDYNYDLIPIVPFKSAKQRHWLVCMASSATILILWAITPLQSAILQTGPVNITQPVVLNNATSLMNSVEQGAVLDQSVLNAAFAVTWLNQPYPAYTTSEYALLPFSTNTTDAYLGTATNWTGTTTKLTSELNCWKPEITRSQPYGLGTFNFYNGQGCNASEVDVNNFGLADHPYRMLYIGYYNSAWADFFLANPHCSRNSSHQFLAVWSKFITQDEKQVSAMWCEASYYKQNVSVTVSLPDYVPINSSIQELGPRTELPKTDFNQSAFEYLMGAGVSVVTMSRDFPASHLVEQYPRLVNEGMSWPVSPMVGFAVGSRNYTVSEYSNDNYMVDAYTASHKMLFSLAIQQTLSNVSETNLARQGTVHKLKYGIIVNRPFSIAVEALSTFLAVVTLGILWGCLKAQSKLSGDPSSIASLMDIVRDSPDFLVEFSGKGSLLEDDLQKTFENQIFRLRCGCETPSGTMTLEVLNGKGTTFDITKENWQAIAASERTGYYKPIKPIALRKDVGSVFLVSLIAMIIVLGVLKSREQQLGGLTTPTNNRQVLQILENYIPTVLATLIEPFWVLLNRLLCILQPFQDMWDGKRHPRGSINSRYTSIPPQLSIFGAIRAHHFLLATVCLVSILTNVLAVGFSGLFNELPTKVTRDVEFKSLISTRISNSSLTTLTKFAGSGSMSPYEDHFYVALANFTSDTPLPPWITNEFLFQPFEVVNSTSDNSTRTFQGPTRGYGIDPNCINMESSTQPPELDFREFKAQNGLSNTPNCTDVYVPEAMMLNLTTYPPHGKSAVEITDQLETLGGLNPCQKILIAGWGRTLKGENSKGTVNSSFVTCWPQFRTAMFNVSVDAKGYVQSYNRTSDYESSLGYPASKNHTDTLIILQNQLFRNNDPQWHNDSVTRSWMDEFVKMETGSDAIVNPDDSIPAPSELLQKVEDIYVRLFAILLGLNMDIFPAPKTTDVASGSSFVDETRIFISETALIISLTILALAVVTGVIFYGIALKLFLPRIPTTVGSIMAYLAPSRAVREFDGRRSVAYGFGRFVGDDGRAHVGIEQEHLIVPLKLSALRKGDTAPKSSWSRALRFRKGEKEKGNTWL